jgi:hypothetical protein
MPPLNTIPNKGHLHLPCFASDVEKDGNVGICL